MPEMLFALASAEVIPGVREQSHSQELETQQAENKQVICLFGQVVVEATGLIWIIVYHRTRLLTIFVASRLEFGKDLPSLITHSPATTCDEGYQHRFADEQ
jgi:hypothetical protein